MTAPTPSTEQVRAHYVLNQNDRWEPERGKAFDCWLQQVKADALADAAVVFEFPAAEEQYATWREVARWLRARAAALSPATSKEHPHA